MIILILICVAFSRLAKRKNLSAILWAVIGGASYFGGQILAVLLFAQFDSYTLSFGGAALGISLVGGIAGVIIAWIALGQAAKKKNNVTTNTDLIDDDQFLERL